MPKPKTLQKRGNQLFWLGLLILAIGLLLSGPTNYPLGNGPPGLPLPPTFFIVILGGIIFLGGLVTEESGFLKSGGSGSGR